jgi:hypothetical protein
MLFYVLLLDTCSVGTDIAFIGIFSWMILTFFIYLWDVGLMLLIFFQIFLTSPWLLMSCSLFEKSIYLFFIWQSLYIFCAMCWVQKWWTTSRCWFLPFKIWSLKNCPYTQMLIWVNGNFIRTDNLFMPPLHEPILICYTFLVYYNNKYKW